MPAAAPDPIEVDGPTLGFLAADWIEAHCTVPDGFSKGRPFVLQGWQLKCTAEHYQVKPGASFGQLAPAFRYRRSQIIAPQKTGKGPAGAAWICFEGLGPAVFAGWARGGEVYVCRENGCDCDFYFEFDPGDPMGRRWPTPLIQLTATAEDQTDNVFRPLQAMMRTGPMAEQVRVGEEFIRLPNEGLIDVVTSSARSRLGQPVTFVLHDETGLWTKSNGMVNVADTQRRGLAGMGGRSIETTNCFDPAENSQAQLTHEARAEDIYRFYRKPPANLSYKNKVERARIHRYVYDGSPWVDLDAIEAEAAELLERDPAQAERFFGNRIVYGKGTWLPDGLWERATAPRIVQPGTACCGGFDGSDSDDWTALRLETEDGYRFTPTYGPDSRPTIWDPAEWGGRIPRSEIHAAMDEIAKRYRLVRVYCDPPGYQSEIEDWALRHGRTVFIEWATYRITQMHDALERSVTDLVSSRSTHDDCPITTVHVANARKLAKPGQRYILGKPTQTQKIDAAMADTLAHEAASDARAAGAFVKKSTQVLVMR